MPSESGRYTLTVVVLLLLAVDFCTSEETIRNTRQFRQLSINNVSCENKENTWPKELLACNTSEHRTDCLIEEISSNGTADNRDLQLQEWVNLQKKLQQLAEEAITDDEYPDTMPLSRPLRRLRNRLCPVRYKVMLYPENVPMLIVHAECIRNKPALRSDANLKCEEINHFRQVYKRLPGCIANGEDRVFLKHFETVTVNCVAKYI